MEPVVSANEEAIEAWNGVLYDRFVKFRAIVTAGLGLHGEEALRLYPPQTGERVLDIGCGFGDTTQRIAGFVGPDGRVVGIDAAPRFVETAREEAEEASVRNVEFVVGDVQATEFDERFDARSRVSERCSSPIRSPPCATCGRRSFRADAW
jgi:2-polyprenyl-3-methyl-5-hydroxy-6-metoxy-1,4-benzoquinol methylase